MSNICHINDIIKCINKGCDLFFVDLQPEFIQYELVRTYK